MFGGLELFYDNFPNKSLLDKIDVFIKNKDDDSYSSLISEMEKSIFLLPLLSNKGDISGFPLISFNNKNFACIFSSMEEFTKWYKDYELNFMFYSIDEMCSLISKKENDIIDGFIVDPNGLNMVFDEEIIKKRVIK